MSTSLAPPPAVRTARGPAPALGLPSLTGLRAVAAFVVLAYHVRNFGWFGGDARPVVDVLFGAGHTGVSLFFVLSGFVLAWSTSPCLPAGTFWWRRLARVYPLHLVTAAVSVLLGLTLLPSLRPADPAGAVANLLLVSSWQVRWWQVLDPVSWSLVCEAFFYLTFPFLAAGLRRLGDRGLAAAGVAAGAGVVALPWLDLRVGLGVSLNSFPPARWPEFVVGCVLGLLVRRGAWRGPGTGVALVVLAVGYAGSRVVPGAFPFAACTLPGIALLLPALARGDLPGRRQSRAGRFLGGRAAVRLGELSFAVYLVHLFVLLLLTRLAQAVLGATTALPLMAAVALAVAAVVLSVGAAAALHRVVEVPARRWLLGRGPGTPRGRHGRTSVVVVHRGTMLTAAAAAPAVLCLGLVLALRPAAVQAPAAAPEPGVVVVIGASVSAGYRASPGGAWPDLLAARLTGRAGAPTVVNASITATRLLGGGGDYPGALQREDRDALSVPGVRTVILTDLVNDLQQPPHVNDPRRMIAGIEQFVARAHARGVRVVVATIPPYGGFERWDAAGERCRTAVNTALRTTHLADGVLDADAVLADPADPTRMPAALDSGDHLHPGDAGHRRLAAAAEEALRVP